MCVEFVGFNLVLLQLRSSVAHSALLVRVYKLLVFNTKPKHDKMLNRMPKEISKVCEFDVMDTYLAVDLFFCVVRHDSPEIESTEVNVKLQVKSESSLQTLLE